MRRRALALVLAGAVLAPLAAAAEEAKAAIAPLILDLTSQPIPSYDSAFKQVMREAGPPPRRSATEGKVLPDGSVQYGEGNGSVIVTVRNPCPEGTLHYVPPPLPGRRIQN